jgi:multiple sugar transport system ATP-binding protein
MAEVILEQLNKIFDHDVHVVKDINLHIKDEEFMVLVGPSGCGKSTTLRMIAGLEDITSGKIKIGDRQVNTVPPKDRDIAMVFQNYALYPHMTVFDNMAFGLKLRNFNKQEIAQRVQEAAEILDLTDYLDRRPKALSGGQRQRVAVGRAIVRKPKVFLFDEPLSNLDAKLRVQMRIEISKLHQKLATTMIYVTHDQVEAMTMGDRITVLKDGIIQQVDTPLNLYNQPKNKFVAGFIGSPAMNFFAGKLVIKDGLYFESGIGSLKLPKNYSDQLNITHNGSITLGVRPEHISITGHHDDLEQQLTARVDVIEPMGNELFIYLSHNDQTYIMRSAAQDAVAIGDTVHLHFDISKIHFFDSQTTENCRKV